MAGGVRYGSRPLPNDPMQCRRAAPKPRTASGYAYSKQKCRRGSAALLVLYYRGCARFQVKTALSAVPLLEASTDPVS